jgi:hypothetical protein
MHGGLSIIFGKSHLLIIIKTLELELSTVEVPADILNRFWIQMQTEVARFASKGTQTHTHTHTSPPNSSSTPGVFNHISITTPVVSDLKNCYV